MRECTEGVCITANRLLVDRLFVYGTLRPSCRNRRADELKKSARHLGGARIAGRLYRVAHYPALGPPLGETDWVMGDVFEGVTVEMMLRLDDYEGTEYTRQLADVTMLDGHSLTAYLYCYERATEKLEYLPSGNWTSD